MTTDGSSEFPEPSDVTPPPPRRPRTGEARFGVIRPGGRTPTDPSAAPAPYPATPPGPTRFLGPTKGPGPGMPPGPGMGPGPAAHHGEPIVPVVRSTPGPGGSHHGAPPPPGSFGPAMSPTGPSGTYPAPGGSPTAALSANAIVAGLLAGLVGGFLGFVLSRVQGDGSSIASEGELRTYSGVWTMLIGIGIASVLAAWPSITARATEQAVRRAMIGALIGAVTGFAAGFCAQWLYSEMLENIFEGSDWNWDPDDFEDRIRTKGLQARVVGWGLMGAILGVGTGWLFGPKRMINGLIGGGVGGAIGGFIFQKVSETATSNTGPQFVGIMSTGIAIGLLVGVVDQLTRQFWLQGSTGPLRGREVILFKQRTTIGSGANCDLVIANDPAVAPHHCSVVIVGQTLYLDVGAPTTVNGVEVGGTTVLAAGQTIAMGRSSFVVAQRAGAPAAPPAPR